MLRKEFGIRKLPCYSHFTILVGMIDSDDGITIGQLAANAKSNEIPAVQELIRLLDIEGATVVADALNCQKRQWN